ncbi:MAG TPA: hypothetical protein VGI93_04360 [Steroidobacteraceae bacterium]
MHPEIGTDASDAGTHFLVTHHRSARDDSEFLRRETSQLADQIVRESVAEIVVIRIAAEVLKGQHGEHFACASLFLVGRAHLPRTLGRRGDETISFSRDGLDDSWSCASIAHGLAQLSNRRVKRRIEFYDDPRPPDGVHSLFVSDEQPGPIGQQYQQLHWLSIELDAPAVATKLKIRRVQLETTKMDDAGLHWLASLWTRPCRA